MAKEGQANHLQLSEQSEVLMLRYFFHFHSGSVITPDLEGSEFSSLEAAIAEAQRARKEIMADGAVAGVTSARLLHLRRPFRYRLPSG
jgi:hypothetical protein